MKRIEASVQAWQTEEPWPSLAVGIDPRLSHVADQALPAVSRPEIVLSYAGVGVAGDGEAISEPPIYEFLIVARVCAAVPMAVGGFALLGFLITRSDLFAMLGFCTLVLGNVFVLCGVIMVLIYAWSAFGGGSRARWSTAGEVAATLLFLLSNYAAAYACVWIALRFWG